MKIAVAQNRPLAGPVEGNLDAHLALIELAIRNGVKLIVFPELSLTGYEPRLAGSLVKMPEDSSFVSLQAAANRGSISIAAGVPTHGDRLPRISTLMFRPRTDIYIYSKQHLHKDEEPFFEPGPISNGLIHLEPTIALAICYELSIFSHASSAIESGASVYIASVAKNSSGIETAYQRLSEIARQNSILVMMANCVGKLDGTECVGGSSVWNRNGEQVARLDKENEGIIIFDCEAEDLPVSTLLL